MRKLLKVVGTVIMLLMAVVAWLLTWGGIKFGLYANSISGHDRINSSLIVGYGFIFGWTVAMAWCAIRLSRFVVLMLIFAFKTDGVENGR